MKKIKCNECGKYFEAGNHPDGTPNGVGFKLKDGSIYNVCHDCVVEQGKRVTSKERTVFALLIKHENDATKLISQNALNAIKANNGAVIWEGYNMLKYVQCLVFKTRLQRDRCASKFEQLGIDFDTRDDAVIDERYYKGWEDYK